MFIFQLLVYPKWTNNKQVKDDIHSHFTLRSYDVYNSNRENKKKGGTALHIHNNCAYTAVAEGTFPISNVLKLLQLRLIILIKSYMWLVFMYFVKDFDVKQSMYIEPTCEQEILNIVNELANKGSENVSDMSKKFLKQIILCILKPLNHMCNLSLTTGVFELNIKNNKYY